MKLARIFPVTSPWLRYRAEGGRIIALSLTCSLFSNCLLFIDPMIFQFQDLVLARNCVGARELRKKRDSTRSRCGETGFSAA